MSEEINNDGGLTTMPVPKAKVKKPPAKKAKAKPKAKKAAKPKAKKKVSKNAKRAKSARKADKAKKAAKPKAGVIVRSERLDMRLSKAEKAKVMAKAAKLRRTVTSLMLEAIEKIK